VDFKDPVDTTTPGDKEATVVVTYPDGSSEEVTVTITVVDPATDADKNTPEVKDQTVNVGETPKAEDSISNLPDLPAGTTVDFKDPVDTTTPGDKEATVIVTYPDGSSEEVTVKITVKETENLTSGTNESSSTETKVPTPPAAQVASAPVATTKASATTKSAVLPNTGQESNSATVAAGVGLLLVGLSSLAFASRKRKEENDSI
ncbi:TPA: Rib/alpha-like domain-containing protein, partial [Streptococcus suis]